MSLQNKSNKLLQVLHLEDDLNDRKLVENELAHDGLHCRLQYAVNQNEFESALAREPFDVIISDYTLPSYDGQSALAVTLKQRPDTPFVLLSGTIGEERAVEFLKGGAADCVLKNHLRRLGPVVRRALREAEERRGRKTAEETLQRQAGQLRALAARLQATREEERLRISREIHDELGAALTAHKFGLEWIRQRVELGNGSKEQIFAKVDSLKALTDATVSHIRKLCTELRPSILDDLGLDAAIEWQAREFQTRTNIRCDIDRGVSGLNFEAEKATAIFRIFQEILTNAGRHSHASKVRVQLKTDGEKFILQVKDNGRGIEAAQIAGGTSLGLLGMRERAMLLGGEVQIHGTAGKGTTVTVSIPRDLTESKKEPQPS